MTSSLPDQQRDSGPDDDNLDDVDEGFVGDAVDDGAADVCARDLDEAE